MFFEYVTPYLDKDKLHHLSSYLLARRTTSTIYGSLDAEFGYDHLGYHVSASRTEPEKVFSLVMYLIQIGSSFGMM